MIEKQKGSGHQGDRGGPIRMKMQTRQRAAEQIQMLIMKLKKKWMRDIGKEVGIKGHLERRKILVMKISMLQKNPLEGMIEC